MRCDWGCNISIGHDTFINFNLTILDEAPVTIGNHVFIDSNVSIFTACHPLDAEERNTQAMNGSRTYGQSATMYGSEDVSPYCPESPSDTIR